jgi:transposase
MADPLFLCVALSGSPPPSNGDQRAILPSSRKSYRFILDRNDWESTEKQLDKISKQVARRTNKPMLAAEIGLKVGKVLDRYKMAKHFDCTIGNGTFGWSRREESIHKEASLDGIYVIRTSEPAERLSSEDMVCSYKSLAQVEPAFRSLKSIDLMVCPIRQRK